MQMPFLGKHWGILVGCIALLFCLLGFLSFSRTDVTRRSSQGPEFSSGWQDKAFFDRVYRKVPGDALFEIQPQSAVVAHHLLVASDIASVIERFRKDPPRTIVLVSPNHFSVGLSAMQVSLGHWKTPYGLVETDVAVAKNLLAALPELKNEERTFAKEHGINAITPFFAHSLPGTKIVAIALDTSADSEALHRLGEVVAGIPGAVLIASVDMAHYRGEEETAAIDADVLRRLETNGACTERACTVPLEIDSNASLAVLAAFNRARGATVFHLLFHTSSLGLGATRDPAENTSHIQGYYSLP